MLKAEFDLSKLDGLEIKPGIFLIGTPSWIENEWRCLANVDGMLAVIVITIKLKGEPC